VNSRTKFLVAVLGFFSLRLLRTLPSNRCPWGGAGEDALISRLLLRDESVE
jgi:hypothetical protein